MLNPKCPKCPYGRDNGVLASTAKPGNWYCSQCGSYFKKIGDVSPPEPTVKSLIKLETDPALIWASEEVTSASDPVLAQFYAGINSEDRADLERHRIGINGDFRVPNEKEIA